MSSHTIEASAQPLGTDTDSTGNVSTATATFNVSPGESVTCVFTNAVRTAPALPPWATGLLALLLAAAGLRAVRGAGGLGWLTQKSLSRRQ